MINRLISGSVTAAWFYSSLCKQQRVTSAKFTLTTPRFPPHQLQCVSIRYIYRERVIIVQTKHRHKFTLKLPFRKHSTNRTWRENCSSSGSSCSKLYSSYIETILRSWKSNFEGSSLGYRKHASMLVNCKAKFWHRPLGRSLPKADVSLLPGFESG